MFSYSLLAGAFRDAVLHIPNVQATITVQRSASRERGFAFKSVLMFCDVILCRLSHFVLRKEIIYAIASVLIWSHNFSIIGPCTSECLSGRRHPLSTLGTFGACRLLRERPLLLLESVYPDVISLLLLQRPKTISSRIEQIQFEPSFHPCPWMVLLLLLHVRQPVLFQSVDMLTNILSFIGR